MTALDRAVESTWAMVLARFVTPGLMALSLAVGTYYANRIEWLITEMINAKVAGADINARLSEVERRLNSRRSPISEVVRNNFGPRP